MWPVSDLRWIGDYSRPHVEGVVLCATCVGDAGIDRFCEAGEAVLRRHPGLTLRVEAHCDDVGGYAVYGTYPCSEAALDRLFACPALSRLRYLWFTGMYESQAFGDGNTLLARLGAVRMPEMRELALDGRPYTLPLRAPALAALAASKHLARLTNLDLGGCRTEPDAVAVLLSGPGLPGLRRLGLRGALATRRGVDRSTEHYRIPNVESEGACVLAQQAGAARLTHLDVSGNGLTDNDAVVLAGLERLDVSENAITPGGAGRLRARFGDRVVILKDGLTE